MAAMQLTRTHRILIALVVTGAVLIAAIGFAGSYSAVRDLAERKGFGDFALWFPIGIDAGIVVLLALDLLLTWMRIPFPMLRQTAWLLTVATIAFNGAASWPDPLGVGMHAVIPVLFVVSVEAARHAVGRIADITADKHMEGVRLTRWLLSPVPTFKLWRRMKLWELRSYEQVIKLEQDRLIYQARLQARFGRAWRRKAPVESLMPLRLAKFGVPLAETAPAGLAAAGIEPILLPPPPRPEPRPELTPEPRPEPRPELSLEKQPERQPELPPAGHASEAPGAVAGTVAGAAQGQDQGQGQGQGQGQDMVPDAGQGPVQGTGQGPVREQSQDRQPAQSRPPQPVDQHEQAARAEQYEQPGLHPQQQVPGSHASPWFAAPQVPQDAHENAFNPTYVEGLEPTPVQIPSGPGRTRPLGGIPGQRIEGPEPAPAQQDPQAQQAPQPQQNAQPQHGQEQGQGQVQPEPSVRPEAAQPGPVPPIQPEQPVQPVPYGPQQPAPRVAEEQEFYEAAYPVFASYANDHADYPSVEQLDIHLSDVHGIRHARSATLLRRMWPDFKQRFQSELEADHIA